MRTFLVQSGAVARRSGSLTNAVVSVQSGAVVRLSGFPDPPGSDWPSGGRSALTLRISGPVNTFLLPLFSLAHVFVLKTVAQ